MVDSSRAELSVPEIIRISPAEIKKNQKKHDRNSTEDIIIAVEYLAKIMDGLKKELGRKPFRAEILTEMKRIGFSISETTLWRYRGKIKTVRTAVRDLLEEGTYSAYFEHNMELLDDIEEESRKCYDKTWTNSKTVNKQTYDSKDQEIIDLTDEHITGELAGPKASFLTILTRVFELRNNALNNENINLASAMLSEDYQNLKEKLADSERKRLETEKELKSTIRKKRGKTETSSN